MVSFPQVSPPEPCAPLSLPPYVPHDLPLCCLIKQARRSSYMCRVWRYSSALFFCVIWHHIAVASWHTRPLYPLELTTDLHCTGRRIDLSACFNTETKRKVRVFLSLQGIERLRPGHTERGLPQRTAVSVLCGMLHSKQTLLTIIFWKHSS